MVEACFRVNGLHWETRAHRKQRPAFSYAKGRVSGVLKFVILGAKKFFFLLVFLLFGMVKISAQSRLKNTDNRVSKTKRQIADSVMRGIRFDDRQSTVKRDTVTLVEVDTFYLTKLESIEQGESIKDRLKKDAPFELVLLVAWGVIVYILSSILKKMKFYYHHLQKWYRRNR